MEWFRLIGLAGTTVHFLWRGFRRIVQTSSARAMRLAIMSLMTSAQSLVLTGNTSFLFECNTIIEYLVKFNNATRRHTQIDRLS